MDVMRVRLVAAVIACSIVAAGCGGDDGIYTPGADVNVPAQEAPPASGTAEELGGSGLLHPRKKPRPEKAKARHQREKQQQKSKPKAARQDVAGAQRENTTETVSAPIGSIGEPEADAPRAKRPPLTADQSAALESVRATLRALFSRMNARDGSLCTELLTQRHVEEATGVSGPEAVARCREDVTGSDAVHSLNKISGVRIQGDVALIRFASSIGDYARWQVLRVQRSGAGWLFDGDGSADL